MNISQERNIAKNCQKLNTLKDSSLLQSHTYSILFVIIIIVKYNLLNCALSAAWIQNRHIPRPFKLIMHAQNRILRIRNLLTGPNRMVENVNNGKIKTLIWGPFLDNFTINAYSDFQPVEAMKPLKP